MHFGGFLQSFPGLARRVPAGRRLGEGWSGGTSMIDPMTKSLRSRAGPRRKVHDSLHGGVAEF